MASASNNNDRRSLHFDTIDDALADIQSLAAAEREGRLRAVGQWTFGQILGHLAAWVDYAFTGAPVKIPFFVPWLLRPAKRWMLSRPFPAGSKIPRVDGGTLAKDVLSTDDGLARFRESFERLKIECPTLPNMLLGRLTHEEWIRMNLRHAELHLSFLRPD